MSVEAPDLAEQLAAGGFTEPLAGEHERDVLSRLRQAFEGLQGLRRGARADDRVVARVAVAELAQQLPQGLGVVIDCEEDGTSHCECRER